MNDEKRSDDSQADQTSPVAKSDYASALEQLTTKTMRSNPQLARELLDGLPLEDRVRVALKFTGADRRELIFLSEQAQALTRALPAPELWLTLKEIGEDDALDLLRLASSEQTQYVLDLECWHKDALDPLGFLYWIMLMNSTGPQTLISWFRQADEDFLLASLARFFDVYKTDPDDEGNEPWREFNNLWTQDDTYYLHFKDPKIAPTIEEALKTIRAQEGMKYYGMLDALEMLPVLERESEAYRFRMARLADWGFVDFDEAMEIYRPLSERDLDALGKQTQPLGAGLAFADPVPEYPLSLTDPPPLMGHALALIRDPDAIADLMLGIGAVVNRVLIADSMDLAKLESVTTALASVHAFIELGLDRVSGGDPEKAARALVGLSPLTIFRAGYSDVIRLARRADGLLRGGWVSRLALGMELLGDDGHLISGLVKSRPLFYAGADDQGAPVYRGFRDGDEVERARRALSRAEFTGTLFLDALGVSADELSLLKEYHQGLDLVWEAVFLTAVANAFAGAGFCFAPLSPGDTRIALELMLTNDQPRRVKDDVPAALRRHVADAVSRLANAGAEDAAWGEAFAEECLLKLEAQAKDLDLESLDPRYFTLIVMVPA